MDRYRVITRALLRRHIKGWVEGTLSKHTRLNLVAYTETPNYPGGANLDVTLILENSAAPVGITQGQANEILDILNGAIEEEECFIDQAGKKNCFHCQIERAVGYLFDGGLKLRKHEEESHGTR